MSMKAWLLLIVLLPVYSFSQEEEQLPFPEVMLLYKSDLVVDAYIIKKDSAVYTIKIADVLIGKNQGVKKEQRLQVRHKNVPGCGFDDFNMSGQLIQARFYLQKEQTGWKLCEWQKGAKVNRSATETYFSFRTENIHIKTKELGSKLREFYQTYSMNPQDSTFRINYSEDSVKLIAKRNVLVRQFEEEGRSIKTPFRKQELQNDPVPEKTMLGCPLLEIPPKYNGQEDLNIILKEIQAELIYPETDNQLEGRVYLSFTIEADGLLDNITILRGLREDYNKQAIEALQTHVKWEPGYQRGKPEACTITLPITFRLPEN